MSQTHDITDRGLTYSTPRWVKVFGIIVLVLVLLIAIIFVTGLGGEHGPGRHTSSVDTPSANVTDDHIPPVEHSAQQP